MNENVERLWPSVQASITRQSVCLQVFGLLELESIFHSFISYEMLVGGRWSKLQFEVKLM
jgi:hypothetical protein